MTRVVAKKPISRRVLAQLGLLALCWSVIGHGDTQAPLPLFHAEYNLKRNGVTLGMNTRALAKGTDGTFIYSSTTKATGIIAWFVKDQIDEYSKWRFDGQHIRPIEYIYNRHGGSKTRHVKLDFDWQHHTVTNTIDGDPWRMEIPPDAQDKLVYQLSIMNDLRNGKKNLEYKIADGGKLKDYSFDILGEEMLNTAMGRIKTVRIQRIGDVRDTTVWCAPQLSYLPVRLEQQDTDGANLIMQITSVRGINKR